MKPFALAVLCIGTLALGVSMVLLAMVSTKDHVSGAGRFDFRSPGPGYPEGFDPYSEPQSGGSARFRPLVNEFSRTTRKGGDQAHPSFWLRVSFVHPATNNINR